MGTKVDPKAMLRISALITQFEEALNEFADKISVLEKHFSAELAEMNKEKN